MKRQARSASPASVRLLAWLSLCGMAAVIALPGFGFAGLFHVDNAVHIAELYELSRIGLRGWSELSCGGFPLGSLHSPLWFGLAAEAVKLGLDVRSVWGGLLWLGLVAPALALLHVGGRHASLLWAWFIALLWLALPTHTFGYSAPVGGMWTFQLGLALLILLIGELTRNVASLRPVRIAVLLALIGLTHLFVLPLAAVLCLTTAIGRARTTPSGLPRELTAWFLASLASVIYWQPTLHHMRVAVLGRMDLPWPQLLLRLSLPTNVTALMHIARSPWQAVRTDLFLIDALPMAGLLLLVIVAHRPGRRRPDEALFRVGRWMAGLTFLLLLAAHTSPVALLGPVSWRTVDFVHLGWALMAIGAGGVVKSDIFTLQPRRYGMLALGVVASGVLWGTPFRTSVRPMDRAAFADLQAGWDWLATQRVATQPGQTTASRGRVYLQDTFTDRGHPPLAMSHAAVLQRLRTGRRQLGAYYGVHPYLSGHLTASEVGKLYNRSHWSPPQLAALLRTTAVDTVILSDKKWSAVMARIAEFRLGWQRGLVSIWLRRGRPISWLPQAAPGVSVSAVHYDDHSLSFTVDVAVAGSAVLSAVAYHPDWQLQGPTPARLRVDLGGMMAIDDLPLGHHEIVARWRPPVWPWQLSVGGWVLLLLWWLERRQTGWPRGRRRATLTAG